MTTEPCLSPGCRTARPGTSCSCSCGGRDHGAINHKELPLPGATGDDTSTEESE